MPMTASHHQFPWRGAETIALLRDALARHDDVQLQLPADYHNAVFMHFGSDLGPECVNVSGGAELLRELARIHGLDTLAQLESSIAASSAVVQVMSPSPTVAITFKPKERT
ncbi:MAG: hypothetical protein HY308_02135 [Gammaproteobacteria bacterium]|nr:hypothetical protein [Gammaproteobacteria bacterium]